MREIEELLASLDELPITAHSAAIATAQAKFTERLLKENSNGNPPRAGAAERAAADQRPGSV